MFLSLHKLFVIGSISNFVEAYFAHPQLHCNVIAVEYTPLATWDNYFIAANNAVRVGYHSGEVIGVDLLMNGLGQTPDQIHAIGHSLGGHVVGHFGRAIKEIGGEFLTKSILRSKVVHKISVDTIFILKYHRARTDCTNYIFGSSKTLVRFYQTQQQD